MKRMFLILFLVFAYISKAKGEETPEELLPKAFNEYSNKRYTNALEYYKRIITSKVPIDQSLLAFVHFHRALNFAMLNESDSALVALKEAVNNGYAEVNDLRTIADLKNVRTLSGFNTILNKAEENVVKKKVFNVELWENPGLGFAGLHQFDSVTYPDLMKYRIMYMLDTLQKENSNQLTHQVQVMNWVHGLWKHNPIQSASSQHCITILDEVKQGKTFRCMEYASVLAQSLQALGYQARIVELCAEGMSYGLAKAHAATEVWNDDLQKWIFLDPQNNAVWKDGEKYLNAGEIREIIQSKKDDSLLMVVFPSDWLSIDNVSPAVWRKYFHYIFLHYDNRYTSNPETLQQLAPVCFLRQGQTPELLYQGLTREIDFSTNYEKIYPRLNLTHISVKSVEYKETPSVNIELSNSINSFDYYQVTVDNQLVQKTKNNSISWSLRKGKNTLSIRGINKAGLNGGTTKVAIDFSGSESKK